MKIINVIIASTFINTIFLCNGFGQGGSAKPALKLDDLTNWPVVSWSAGISANGDFAYYYVENETPENKVLHVRSINGNRETKLNAASDARFSADGTMLFGMLAGKTLFILHLKEGKIDSVSDVSKYSLLGDNEKESLFYEKASEKKTVILNLKTKRESNFPDSNGFFVSPDGKYVVLNERIGADANNQSLMLVDLATGTKKQIWKGSGVTGVKFARHNGSIAFIAETPDVNKNMQKSIWVYKQGEATAQMILDSTSANLGAIYRIDKIDRFVGDDQGVMFFIRMLKRPAQAKTMKASVDVYSFTDQTAYTTQLGRLTENLWGWGSFYAIVNIKSKKIIFRQPDDEYFNIPSHSFDEIGFSVKQPSLIKDNSEQKMYTVSTITGNKMPIKYAAILNNAVSADGKYILLIDGDYETRNLYSYEVATGHTRNITENLPIPALDKEFKMKWAQHTFKLGAWLEGSSKMLLYDNYDIWKIDASGKEKPMCITNGFGRKNRIVFNLSSINFPEVQFKLPDNIIITKEQSSKVILASYDFGTGENDYYSINLNEITNPQKLTNGGFLNEVVDIKSNSLRASSVNVKATKKDIYLIGRENASNAFNFFTTADFKSFKPVSNNCPEKKFNWLTAEKVTFTSLDGEKLKGSLYKPENFDSTKKYPVIFYFYEKMSQDFYLYHEPELSGAVVNIPYFASNGYLVFTPDIDATYGKGRAGEDALNSVMGAANYMAVKSWVDSTKMAIHGHSWGGFECNYIVTHTNRFAAAVAASGPTDVVGEYGLTTHGGIPGFSICYDYLENGTIYDSLDAYIRNSPKLFANRVNTPLLIMHNEKDGAVNFQDGLGFFNSLWKLGKRAWMLQYDEEGHVIQDENNQRDYTIRLKQFLDHYLQDAPPPKWMVQGIAAKMKGVEDGLELMPSATIPLPVAGK